MTREEVGLALDADRKHTANLWRSVTLGQYVLMQQGDRVLLVSNNTIVWSSAEHAKP